MNTIPVSNLYVFIFCCLFSNYLIPIRDSYSVGGKALVSGELISRLIDRTLKKASSINRKPSGGILHDQGREETKVTERGASVTVVNC